jgi:hypothetical protein
MVVMITGLNISLGEARMIEDGASLESAKNMEPRHSCGSRVELRAPPFLGVALQAPRPNEAHPA